MPRGGDEVEKIAQIFQQNLKLNCSFFYYWRSEWERGVGCKSREIN